LPTPVVRSIRRFTLAVCAALVLGGALPAAAPAAQTAGVQAHLLWSGVDAAEVERQLAGAKAAGAGMVRVDVGWAGIEPVKGERSDWYLGRLDRVVERAGAHDLDVLLTFWETPCWASSAPESAKQGCEGAWWERGVQLYPPTRPDDYAKALAFVAGRYGSRVRGWEIWNEPNSYDYFRSSSPARDYAALVKAAYPKAKAAAPRSTIVAGSLMWADADFTRRLYDEGIGGCFDAFSIHPYSDDRSPVDGGHDAYIRGSFLRGVPAVHDVMVAERDAKPLWLTEFGWSTSTVRGSANWRNGVSEETQADYVFAAFEQMREWSYVDVGVYFNLVDTGTRRDAPEDNFGLRRGDGTAKPSWHAFRRAALTTSSGGSARPASAASAPAPAPASTAAARPSGGKPRASMSRAQRRARRLARRQARRQAAAARRAVRRCKRARHARS
jgi:hypothetical protein